MSAGHEGPTGRGGAGDGAGNAALSGMPLQPEAPMEAPWQGEVFALTVAAADAGLFSWKEWTAHFGQVLADRGKALGRPLDGGADYWQVWLDAFETLAARRGGLPEGVLSERTAAWRAAYLRTPHGKPVRLEAAADAGHLQRNDPLTD